MPRLAVGLTVLVGLLASLGAGWSQQRAVDRTVDARFDAAVSEVADGLDDRLTSIELATLATRALFGASETVRPAGFANFVSSLTAGRGLSERYEGLAAIAEVDAASGQVQLVAPSSDPLGLLGRSASDGALAAGLDEAARLALPVVTVLPVDEALGTARLVVVAAVYADQRASQPLATEAVRRSTVVGWIVSAVDANTMLEGVLPSGARNVTVALTDADGSILGDTGLGDANDVARNRQVLLNQTGTTLRLDVTVGHNLVSPAERRVPVAVVVAGLLLTAAAAAVVWLATTQRARALAMVDEATGALADSNAELAAGNDRLRQFSHAVAHDLKTPLSTVHGFVSLAVRHLHRGGNEQAIELLERAEAGGMRMARMIDDLLTYAVAGEDVTESTVISIDALVNGVIESLHGARRAGDQLVVETNALVECHEPRIRQLFANLLANALKFRREDQSCRIEVTATPADGHWVFTVADDGVGIPPESRERVLEAFARGEAKREGTGLGLAICQKIVEAHGGSITIGASSVGGTAIRFDLPAAVRPSPPSPAT